jgi:ubiquinone/menaquinone biosynthesis C-methylase UbiE
MQAENQETERIQRVYATYAAAGLAESKWSLKNPGNLAIHSERSRALAKALARSGLLPLSDKHVLEVGCGSGGILRELILLGAKPSLLSGIDLIADRVESARIVLPEADLRVADARSLPFEAERFDLVMVFTVFSSILDAEVARQVATEIRRVLKPAGAVIWYDFQYNNPRNPNVRGIKQPQVATWFPGFRSYWKTLTVLPPLARRLGAVTAFVYPILAAIPLFRTHLMGVMLKPSTAGAA